LGCSITCVHLHHASKPFVIESCQCGVLRRPPPRGTALLSPTPDTHACRGAKQPPDLPSLYQPIGPIRSPRIGSSPSFRPRWFPSTFEPHAFGSQNHPRLGGWKRRPEADLRHQSGRPWPWPRQGCARLASRLPKFWPLA